MAKYYQPEDNTGGMETPEFESSASINVERYRKFKRFRKLLKDNEIFLETLLTIAACIIAINSNALLKEQVSVEKRQLNPVVDIVSMNTQSTASELSGTETITLNGFFSEYSARNKSIAVFPYMEISCYPYADNVLFYFKDPIVRINGLNAKNQDFSVQIRSSTDFELVEHIQRFKSEALSATYHNWNINYVRVIVISYVNGLDEYIRSAYRVVDNEVTFISHQEMDKILNELTKQSQFTFEYDNSFGSSGLFAEDLFMRTTEVLRERGIQIKPE